MSDSHTSTTSVQVKSPLGDNVLGKQDILIVAILLAIALIVRTYSLQFFHVISTDGTSYALAAKAIANGNFHDLGIYGFYPALIYLANIVTNDLEIAGRSVSVCMGTLLIPTIYLVGKTFFSRHIGIAAAVITAVWPSFVSFSCEVMTQATHTTLQLLSIYLVWQAYRKPTIPRSLIAGLFIGITYLTRPESIMLFVMMPLALFTLNPDELRNRPLFLPSYVAGFMVLFLVNVMLVHHITGEWQLSAKTDSALNDALSYYLNQPDLNYFPGYRPKGYLDILKEHPGFIWHNSWKNLKELWSTLLPPSFWLLFTIGFCSGGLTSEQNRLRLFLLATLTPIAVLILFYYISPGYIQAYQPLVFIFTAHGFAVLENFIKSRCTVALIYRTPFLLIFALVYGALLFAPQVRKDIPDSEYWPQQDDGRRSEKHIGKLLKANLPPGILMTRWARIAFYAEREWINVPAAYFDEIIQTARAGKARFLVADGCLFENRPGLGDKIFQPFSDRNIPPGLYFFGGSSQRIQGLKPYLIYRDPRSIGVIVYEIDQ